jgi:hypothetical protein
MNTCSMISSQVADDVGAHIGAVAPALLHTFRWMGDMQETCGNLPTVDKYTIYGPP